MAAAARNAFGRTTKVQGRVERYLSGPSSDGYAIVRIRTRSGALTIKGRGMLTGFDIGDSIEVEGRETTHPRYGRQMQAIDARGVDDIKLGLVRWIAQAGFKDVGEARAQAIVDALGHDALEQIVEGSPEARTILGARFAAVQKSLAARWGEAKFGARLAAYDIGKQTRQSIFEAFGADTGKIVETEPYQLINRVKGIAFQTADNIARAAGIDERSEERIAAAAIDTMRSADRNGHTWIPISDVIIGTVRRTRLETRYVAEMIARAEPEGIAIVTHGKGDNARRGWALDKIARRETRIASMIAQKAAMPKRCSREEAARLVSLESASIGIELNPLQTEAAIMAVVEPIAVITGFPGTGKTTVLKVIVRCWKALANKISLASPTGKAAQRMHEATKVAAETVHRLLVVEEGGFAHNARNPLDATAIAIDESSMLDVSLTFSLLSASMESQLLLIGDADQLASVDAGRVFGDLVDSPVIPTVRLTEIRRQAEGSAIAAGAATVREGQMPEWKNDLEFFELDDNAEIAAKVAELHKIIAGQGHDVQVLTPGHAGECGTISLNETLAPMRKRAKRTASIGGGAQVQVGDKVIQTRNDSKQNVYNGDSGRVTWISESGKSLTVRFDGARQMEITYGDRTIGDISPAWALSIHKAQGSEYDVVIIPMTSSHWTLLGRELLNTGITRARTRCIVVGQARAIRQAIETSEQRNSRLCDLLDA